MKRILFAAVWLAVSAVSLTAVAPGAQQPAEKSDAGSAGKAAASEDKAAAAEDKAAAAEDKAASDRVAPNKNADHPAGGRPRQNRRAQAAAQAAQEPAPPPPPTAGEAGVPVLSAGDSHDDFASVAEAPDGSLYAAYAAYYDGHDQIRLHKRLAGGKWSTRTHVPTAEARADIWMPQIAVDRHGHVWAIWSEQTGQTSTSSGNWDIYARSFDGNAWGPLVRVSDDPKPDINPYVAVDAKRNIYVVWQGHADNTGDVMLAHFKGHEWSKPLAVTKGPESDWYPQADVDAQGKVWIAFDSYRNGDYDVFLTSVDGDRVGQVVPIATSRYYEAHPTVACAADGRVWIAWEQGGFNWGKDQGYWLRLQAGTENSPDGQPKQQGLSARGVAEAHPAAGGAGTALGGSRNVQLAVYSEGKLQAGPDLTAALPEVKGPKITAMPALAVAEDGRIWLRFRRMNRGPAKAKGQFSRYWTEDVTYLTDQGWKPSKSLPGSTGRISVFSRILPLADGGLAVAYSGDQREATNYHQPIRDYALVTVLDQPDDQLGVPMLADYQAPAPPPKAKTWDAARERAEVEAARSHRVSVDGKSLRIVRGDLHRHTELSWDVGPGNDGSILDFYRYMIDVASMDFGALTDHQGGGHYAYHWWLTQKTADMYYLAPRFVPLYGYERSVSYPNGHRNVFHSYRGVPIFTFQIKLDQAGIFPPGIAANKVLDNDTKLLYQYLRKTGGVAISHTSATDMGTDWRDNDPEIEPVVEIYQGARNSSEVLGGPRVHDISTMRPEQAPGGYQPAGIVWNALAKGYRLGMTSSSDHGSTHISYSLVYTPENDRAAILDAIRQRHTYGATDNLVVEVWANGHFMGDEFKTGDLPELQLKVQATDKISRIDLVRNNQYVYTTSPLKEQVSIKYTDREPKEGLNYYYFRIQQDDGEVAWASPVWVHYEPGK